MTTGHFTVSMAIASPVRVLRRSEPALVVPSGRPRSVVSGVSVPFVGLLGDVSPSVTRIACFPFSPAHCAFVRLPRHAVDHEGSRDASAQAGGPRVRGAGHGHRGDAGGACRPAGPLGCRGGIPGPSVAGRYTVGPSAAGGPAASCSPAGRSAARRSAAGASAARRSTAGPYAAGPSAANRSAARRSTARRSTARRSTARRSTARRSTASPSAAGPSAAGGSAANRSAAGRRVVGRPAAGR
jgi:hypothetical protein